MPRPQRNFDPITSDIFELNIELIYLDADRIQWAGVPDVASILESLCLLAGLYSSTKTVSAVLHTDQGLLIC